MKRYTISLLIALAALSFTPRPTFVRYYASIKGSNQGQFKATANSPGGQESQGWMEIYSFSIGASNPANTGQQGSGGAKEGKVTLPPIVINKKPDAFSSLLNISLATNETLETVVIQTRDDQNRVTQTTVVKNAKIKEIKKNGTIESISFIYEQIERK
jgi:type VI secretion system Hcp family effector